MGSGCTASSTNGGFFQKLIPDTGVKYTGVPIPALGICTNDLLSEVEAIILNHIVNYAVGKGIFIPNIDLGACALFINDITGCNGTTPKELDDLMVIIFNALCTLYGDVVTLQNQMNDLLSGPYNTSCLTLVANPTLRQIIQGLLIDYCALKIRVTNLETRVTNLENNLNTSIGNFLFSHITTCTGVQNIVKTGSGATTNLEFRGFAPIGSVLPYGGSLSNFDSGGVGKPDTDACGWALADGRAGRINMKGLGVMGTTDMTGTAPVAGGTLPYNSVGGEYAHTITVPETPPLPFAGTNSHNHRVRGVSVNTSTNGAGSNASFVLDVCTAVPGFPGVSTNCAGLANNVEVWFDGRTSIETISITGTTAGTGQPHNNMHPYRALYFIQRMF